MPSFDIVSRTEIPEVDNAIQGAMREIGTRFDFNAKKRCHQEKVSFYFSHTKKRCHSTFFNACQKNNDTFLARIKGSRVRA